jgi:tetratricopeptide (TPR) repeat protein
LPDGPTTAPGNLYFIPALDLLRIGSELALDQQDLATAKLWLDCCERWLEWSGTLIGRPEWHLTRARYEHIAGNLERARERAEQALHVASEPRQPLALLATQRLLGELATASNELEMAGQHLQESLALADASQITDPESSRYALGCIQLQGTSGKMAATDGRQILLQSGFTFPWQEDLLLPQGQNHPPHLQVQ